MFITCHIVLRLTESRIATTKFIINTTDIVPCIEFPTCVSIAKVPVLIYLGITMFGS